jgi:hypothetical protein
MKSGRGLPVGSIVVLGLVLLLGLVLPSLAVAATPVITGATLTADHRVQGPVTVSLDEAVFDCCKPTLKVAYTDPGGTVSTAKTEVSIDGKRISGVTVAQTGLSADLSLTAGSHLAKVVITDAKGCMAMSTYAFTIRCPHLEAEVTGTYRDSFDPRWVHVLWKFTNPGTAEVWETRIMFTADNGVTFLRDANNSGPSFVNSLVPGASRTGDTVFQVPSGVRTFTIGYRSVYGAPAGGVLDVFFPSSHPMFKPGSRSTLPTWKVRLP